MLKAKKEKNMESLTKYDVEKKFKDLRAIAYIAPMIDSMNTPERERFKSWINIYLEYAGLKRYGGENTCEDQGGES